MCPWIIGSFGWWLLAGVLMILLLGLIIWVVVAPVRSAVSKSSGPDQHS